MTSTTLTEEGEQADVPFDAEILVRQIGMPNVLAVSGGRVTRHPGGIELPVRYGWRVFVVVAPNDTYTVYRAFERGGVVKAKGVLRDVSAGQVGDVTYRASCFRDYQDLFTG